MKRSVNKGRKMKIGDLVKVLTADSKDKNELAIIVADDPSGWYWIKWEGSIKLWPAECMEKP